MIFLSTNLRYLRKGRRLTQGQLAEMIGVRPNTISNYEKGISSPDFELLGKLVEIFDIDAHSLLYVDICTPGAVRRVSDIPGFYTTGESRVGGGQKEYAGFMEEIRRDIASLKEAVCRLQEERNDN